MARYPEELIEEVRSRNDIVDLISTHVQLKKKGGSYFGCCPFHNEKTPSFSVSRDKQMYYCFGCGKGGNIFTFLTEYENYTFTEAMEYLADRSGIELPKQELSQEAKQEMDAKALLRSMNKAAAGYFYYILRNKRGERGLQYLTDRGLSEEIMKKFGLGFADIYKDGLYQYLKSKGFKDKDLKDSGLVTIEERGAYDKFFNRVIFPIVDVNNRVIGFGGRVLGDGQPKYLNSKETLLFDKSRNLYGLNFARSTRKHYMILCEGYLDVISMHQAGFTNAVASLGTAFTSSHALLLKRYTGEVVLSFDSDGAGTKAALRAIPILKDAGLTVRVLNLKPYKDPDEFIKNLGAEALEERIAQAMPSMMFEIQVLADSYNQQDPESRTAFQKELAKKLATIPEVLERNNYIEAAANRYYMGAKDLQKLVERYGTMAGFEKKAEEQQPAETREQIRREKDDAKKQPQKLLLTWYVNRPELFEKLKHIIGPDDFVENLYHSVAIMLFDQYAKDGRVTPAQIISQFPDTEEQSEVASLFNARLKVAPLPKDNEKVLTDIVKKVKSNSIEEEMNRSTDIVRWQELIQKKAELQRLHISL
ncbi:MAG: DNA primase [Lachnospiraceae bacterium]|nr:DNA primase [Lachnospiraceae bacterium]